jgi:hypothetical protein
MFLPMTAAVINRSIARPPTLQQEKTMTNIITSKSRFVSAAIALAALAGVSLATAPANAAVVTHVGYVNTSAPVAVNHYGYTRVTPYGVKHVGYTRVWR